NAEFFEDVPEILANEEMLEDREHVFEYNISVPNENTTNENSYNFNVPQNNTLTNYNISRFLQRYSRAIPNTLHNISIHTDGHSLRTDTNIYHRINGPSIHENSLYPGSFEMAQYADKYQMGHTMAENFLY
ncbi:gametocytogenesis-implicated protein, putative, partial [Plasmodium sp. DRC-Itaito]